MIALWTAIKAVPGRIWSYIGLAVFAVWFYSAVRQGGKDAARAEGRAQQLENVGKRNEVDREVGRLPDGDAAQRLHDNWSRD